MNLKQLREKQNLHPAEVARRMGVSRTAVFKIEKTGNTYATTLDAYATAIGVPSIHVWVASTETRQQSGLLEMLSGK